MHTYHLKDHRRSYEIHYGPIPKDSSGRTYEIHHKDGNHNNNDPQNLVALTIQEHYDIHYAQGDYGACARIFSRMNTDPNERSKEASRLQKLLVEQGKHQFQNKEFIEKYVKPTNNKKIANGTHPFQKRPDGTSLTSDQHAAGKGSSDPKVREKLKQAALRQLESGKCVFAGPNNNLSRIAAGTHPSQIKKTCPHCGKICDTANYAKWHGDKCKVLKGS
jgi:hypothetical protein